ncbi:MAG: alpha-L-fucosidase [Clostridiales bacterium]|nr:alpha-L-fucosidase [Clostridiales bacterium]
MRLMTKPEYEAATAATRDARMQWWRDARYGMFIHYGLYSVLKRHEWAMALEGWPVEEYEKLAEGFQPAPGAPREWARIAHAAGMKYMVLTTRHHEGFSLWDSKANPYNSVHYGPKRDIVHEFADACREYGLRIGLYSSLMDWHHPDGGRAAYDTAARRRFLDYIEALNTELLTNYGKIDILWYDVPAPMQSWEGWDSLERNQRLRALQPDILINNRSMLDEDFGTPEGSINPEANHDWEACMTFNGFSWGYVDGEQEKNYGYNAHRILKMLCECTAGCGNLLLNVGPRADGSLSEASVQPLLQVGEWLRTYGECFYGRPTHSVGFGIGSGVGPLTQKGNTLYYWNWIWPDGGELRLGGILSPLRLATVLATGQELAFTQEGGSIRLTGLAPTPPDGILGVSVIRLDFDEPLRTHRFYSAPALNAGCAY